MKPLISETQDAEALRELGRAAVQVVHDLKNQINGLKLYATFLRKRLEKAERPADELETISKLIAGLERAATDTATLVRYGRPVELRRAPRTDLSRLLSAAAEGVPVQTEPGEPFEGDFDAPALSEALKNITAGARPRATGSAGATPAAMPEQNGLEIRLRREQHEGTPHAVIEWRGATLDGEGDPFRTFAGGHGLRLALAARIIQAHGGEAAHDSGVLRVRLPLAKR
ncbi:MAG TPA: hypothetical protein VGB73_00535 [Pyrinomonadaceae bacterium]|jgi:signal transduction histidine kinase